MTQARSLRLVADVGGTNTRIALAEGGVVRHDTIRSLRNAEHDGFLGLLDHLSRDMPIDEAVIAIAGPVSPGVARLTNHDWTIRADEISAALGGARVGLLNDLRALGHSVPGLESDGLAPVIAGTPGGAQSLVAGIGTGFNVSPVLIREDLVICPAAEAGHVGLPMGVHAALAARIGDAARAFPTVEHLFSGRGWAAAYAAFPGGEDADAADIATRAEAGEEVPAAFRDFYAQLIGILARDLTLAYMATGGLYFAGSVARTVLLSPAARAFEEVFAKPFPLSGAIAPPVAVITGDAAALQGCAAFPLPGRTA